MVGPLALTLEACGDGIVTLRLFAVADFSELVIADHQVAGDECHFDRIAPFGVELLTAALRLFTVVIFAFWTVVFDPCEGLIKFSLVVDAFAHAADKLSHVDRFDTHAKCALPE